jgi:hypothetical protein
LREIANPVKPDLACELPVDKDCPSMFDGCPNDCDYNLPQYPTLDIPALRQLLEDLNEWEGLLNTEIMLGI